MRIIENFEWKSKFNERKGEKKNKSIRKSTEGKKKKPR